jgi:hypothetical protein
MLNAGWYRRGWNIESARAQGIHQRWIEELLQKLEGIAPGCTHVLN